MIGGIISIDKAASEETLAIVKEENEIAEKAAAAVNVDVLQEQLTRCACMRSKYFRRANSDNMVCTQPQGVRSLPNVCSTLSPPPPTRCNSPSRSLRAAARSRLRAIANMHAHAQFITAAPAGQRRSRKWRRSRGRPHGCASSCTSRGRRRPWRRARRRSARHRRRGRGP